MKKVTYTLGEETLSKLREIKRIYENETGISAPFSSIIRASVDLFYSAMKEKESFSLRKE